jgi:SAM-dependent methyltransferase
MGHSSWRRSNFNHRASHPAVATCPLCENAGAPRKFYARDRVHGIGGLFAIHRCDFCCAWFIQPWLNAEQLGRFYPAEYGRYRPSRSLEKRHYRGWQTYVLENYYHYPSRNGATLGLARHTIAYLLSFFTARGVIPYRGDGRILDVGCGGGSYLYRLKQWGWETYGVEPSKVGATRAQNLGLEVRQGMLEDARFPDQFFDVIRLSNVVEHLCKPKATFREIHRILRPDGLVYVTVPNTRSLVFWLFHENWYALDTPRHVISYSPKTLTVLAEATGFEIASTNFSAGPFNFLRSLNYLMEEKGSGWPLEIRRIRWERSKFLRRALKPLCFVVDTLGYGDFLHATLRKQRDWK